MLTFPGITPVDFLIIGHITQDITSQGLQPGGPAAYSGLTARAFGKRVGVVTAWAEETGKEKFTDLQIANLSCEASTTFENIYTSEGRLQKLHHLAPQLAFYHIPESWRSCPVIQFAPVAGEVPPDLYHYFRDADIYLTPQGWMREWDQEGNISPRTWLEDSYLMPQAKAVVISEEDVGFNLETIYRMASLTPILAVTKGQAGADIYNEGQIISISAPETEVIDPTGAGDIFAAVFFTQLSHTRDPHHSAELAVQIASDSITRPGLSGVPNDETLYDMLRKVQ